MKFLKNDATVTVKHILLLISFFWFLKSTYSQSIDLNILNGPGFTKQSNDACSLEESLTKLYSKYPEKKQEALKNNLMLLRQVDSIISHKKRYPQRELAMTIPVVFHYFYEECTLSRDGFTEESDLLTNDRFENALERINNDFQGLTSDTCKVHECGKSSIFFKLAEIDPKGYPTNGINRIRSGLTNRGLANYKTLKQVIQWPRNKYINIYVVDEATRSNNSGLAHYPTTSHNDNGRTGNELYDGPTVATWALDPNPLGSRANYGYILTHEIGHWLGLRHIWGDPDDGNYDECRCSMDDFDFYAKFIEDYDTLFENGTLPALEDINDTPNSIGYSIRKETCDTVINSCKDEGETLTECGLANGSVNDHMRNIMDYTPCAEMFTPGQILFMESVLKSDISQRNQLISNNNIAFYANPSEARLVFSEGNTFYESYSNDGSFSNSLKVKLLGQVDSIEVKFNDEFTNQFSRNRTKIELPNNYFSFKNLPNNLEAKVFVTSPTEAEVTISGTTTLNDDDKATFTLALTDNLTNVVISNQQQFSQLVNFDFIEEKGITYSNLSTVNSIGPNSNYYNYISIKALNDIRKYYYLAYLNDENGDEKFAIGVKDNTKDGIEFGMNNDGTIKIFSKYESIDAPKYEYEYYNDNASGVINNIGDIYFRELNFNSETFYVAIKIRTCDIPYYGWLKFKYDNECNSLKATDYAIQNSWNTLYAGKLDDPVIAFHTPIIKNINNGEGYEGFTIELLNSQNSALTLNTNIADYFTVSNAEPDDLTINENDIEISLVDNYTALVKPANTDFWQKNNEFEFIMDILSGAVLGASQHFFQPNNKVEVLSSNKESDFKELNETLQPVNQFWEGFRIQGGELGMQYYSNELNSGFNIYSVGGLRFEFACKPNSNEIDLFDFGDIVYENLNYRKAKTGATTSDFVLKDGELYIPDNAVQAFTGQTKYLVFRLKKNCKTFYGYIEIVFKTNGSVTTNNYYLHLIEGEKVNIGIPKPKGCLACIPKIKKTGDRQDFIYINSFHINSISQPLNNDLTLNSNHYSDYSIPYKDEFTQAYSTLNLSNNSTYNFKIELGGTRIEDGLDYGYKTDAAVWFDLNQNNCFESNEKIYSETNNPAGKDYLEFSHTFPSHLHGNYKMRVYAGFYEAGETGCDEVKYGEFEDHSMYFISACIDEWKISDNSYIPSGSYKAKEITLNTSTKSILFKDESLKLTASNSISIHANTEIQKGSEFYATIEECENFNNKQTIPDSENLAFKVLPNSFNNNCNIQYALNSTAEVSLSVSDISGKTVVTLANKEQQVFGIQKVIFNTNKLPHGIYYFMLTVDEKVETQKVVITK